MSGFSPDWLAAREPWDHAARSPEILTALTTWIDSPDRDPRGHVAIVDLGCGTGSTLRYLGPRLPRPLSWRLVDGDPALLAIAARAARTQPASIQTTHHADLAFEDIGLVTRDADLVTASALIDLVSRPWLERFWRAVTGRGAAVLAGLTYDGRMALTPQHPMDAEIRDLVNRHQRTDKGFGPALGPDAAMVFAGLARGADWQVMVRRSDWVLSLERDHDGVGMLLDGWAEAARAMAPGAAARIEAWRRNRRASPDLRLCIGHRDVLALPPG